jgi:type IV pilus assembly protein PilQ
MIGMLTARSGTTAYAGSRGKRRSPSVLRRTTLTLAGLVTLVLGSAQAFAVAVTDIEFSSRPGSKFEVRLDFDEAPPAELQSYTIEKPARIAIDFPDTQSQLDSKRYSLPYGNATGCWCSSPAIVPV